MMLLRSALLSAICALLPSHALAQTVHDATVWASVFGDHRLAPRTSLYWDYSARRAEHGTVWQQHIGAVGLTRTLTPHWRAAAGLSWAYGYRYGAFASRTNSFELRPWLQVLSSRKRGSVTWSDRSRVEFRAVRRVGALAPDDATWGATVIRFRRLDRVQRPMTADGRWIAIYSQELFVNAHPARVRVAMLEQVRSQALLGRRLSKTNRLEFGYGWQSFNRRGGYEVNHTAMLTLRSSTPIF
jgi:Protein of unknown function (DUF2490)